MNLLLLLALLSGCCDDAAPPLLNTPVGAQTGVDEVWELPLSELVMSSSRPMEQLEFEVEASAHLTVGVSGDSLYAIPDAGWSGRETIDVRVTDRCGSSEVSFELGVGALGGACGVTLSWQGAASVVEVSGAFNDWGRTALTQGASGVWSVELPLAPGAYPYKFVVDQAWTCDPSTDLFHCDDGYDQGTWSACAPGAGGCNSLLVVPDCVAPTLSVTDLDVRRGDAAASLTVSYAPGLGGAALGAVSITLDGAPLAASEGWSGHEPLTIALTGLAPTRHTVRVEASDTAGHPAEPLYVPFWTDDRGWEGGLLYYAFVDRFDNGDPSNDHRDGTTHPWTDWMGGDWQGVIDRLDYLDDLGVTAIWLTAPQDAPPGVWGEKCGATFTGYHGYWPASAFGVEEHFGTEDDLRRLVSESHARNMRVLVDWVGNHVHESHPYLAAHPGWFNEQRLCNDANNWNEHPLTCWFDPFIPDIDYTQPEPLARMIDDAIEIVKEYGFDGYRVDAVKHMPHSVFANLESRVAREIEHRPAGGSEDFYMVGETFDGDRGLIASYVGPDALDAQFDFPHYFTLRAAFLEHSASLRDLEASWQQSRGAYGSAVMSTFLGNHDVPRFVTVADVGDQGACASGDAIRQPASPPGGDLPYEKLALAWTWLLTHEGLPLVYYGDEIGLPGHQDPDNRQLMRFDGDLSPREARVLDHVRRLGQARRDHPVLSGGDRVVWWEEDDVFAWARALDGQGAVVVVNRSDAQRTLTNGLSWAGLPQGGAWRDVLTGAVVQASGDELAVDVPPRGSVVLVAE